jgi:hypothetical protein
MLPEMAGKAHELHHLGAELLALLGAVADAGVVHQVAQAHDAQADTARPVGGLGQLGHSGHVGVGFDHIVEEDGGKLDALAQLFPIHAAIGSQVLGEVDRAQAAVLVRP